MTASPLTALTLARIREFIREPGAVFWTFGFPLLITVALGIAFRDQGPPQLRVALVDGPRAGVLRAALAREPLLAVETLPADVAAARLRAAAVLLTIDADGAAAAPLVYRFDPTHPEARAARRTIDDILQRNAGRHDALTTRDETAVARGGRYVDWMVPGLLGMQLLSGALWGTAWTIVNARQRRLLKRLAATPMRRRHYLMSFRLAGLLFVPLQVVVLFVFARLTFGVHIQGSLLAVFALSLFGSWSFAGLGLLCAARAQNSETANGLVNLVTLPMFVLCGVFFSSNKFPGFVQPLIRFLPLSAFNEALRHVVNDGASLFSQGRPLLVLTAWGVVSATVALRLFRWT
ncbi:MAG TPA: ABC transporter permease [Polyangia bacterium]|jgi:ABC transporter DrrB family efflux protein